jgi:hypothetical protein
MSHTHIHTQAPAHIPNTPLNQMTVRLSGGLVASDSGLKTSYATSTRSDYAPFSYHDTGQTEKSQKGTDRQTDYSRHGQTDYSRHGQTDSSGHGQTDSPHHLYGMPTPGHLNHPRHANQYQRDNHGGSEHEMARNSERDASTRDRSESRNTNSSLGTYQTDRQTDRQTGQSHGARRDVADDLQRSGGSSLSLSPSHHANMGGQTQNRTQGTNDQMRGSESSYAGE